MDGWYLDKSENFMFGTRLAHFKSLGLATRELYQSTAVYAYRKNKRWYKIKGTYNLDLEYLENFMSFVGDGEFPQIKKKAELAMLASEWE